MQNPDDLSFAPPHALRSDVAGYSGPAPSADDAALPSHEAILADELLGAWHGLVLPNEEDVSVGAPNCQRCETLPRPLTEAGRLMLNFPHSFTLGKVLQLLIERKWRHKHHNGTLEVTVPAGALPSLIGPLVELLSGPEQRDLRAVYHFGDELPQINDFFKRRIVSRFRGRSALDSGWSKCCARRRFTRCFSRLCAMPLDGVAPQNFRLRVPDARRSQRPSRGARHSCSKWRAAPICSFNSIWRRAARPLIGAGRHGIKEKVFINFSPNSIYDPGHCLRSTVNAVEEVGLTRDQVVFEITETERSARHQTPANASWSFTAKKGFKSRWMMSVRATRRSTF